MYRNCCTSATQSTPLTLGGQITNASGSVAAGVPVEYTIRSARYSTTTDANGRYSFNAPRQAQIVITPKPTTSVYITPPYRSFTSSQSQSNLNFTLSPLIPF